MSAGDIFQERINTAVMKIIRRVGQSLGRLGLHSPTEQWLPNHSLASYDTHQPVKHVNRNPRACPLALRLTSAINVISGPSDLSVHSDAHDCTRQKHLFLKLCVIVATGQAFFTIEFVMLVYHIIDIPAPLVSCWQHVLNIPTGLVKGYLAY